MTSLATACTFKKGAMAALTAESVAEMVCESGEDSSTYENDTEDEALVNGEPDEEYVDATERE